MSLLMGALVADAASLGFHWIYDFPHLQKVAGERPEFRDPDPKNYEGVFGFYAHGMRKAGDLSHYGETLLTYLRSQEKSGKPQLRSYQCLYRDTFGPGGPYVGYIDNPTRLTLRNLDQAEIDAVEAAKKVAKALPADVAKVVVQKVIPYTRKFSGRELIEPVTRAIQITYSEPDVLECALAIARAVDETKKLDSGADDQQAPAWSTLPAFMTLNFRDSEEESLRDLESVVRITNNNDAAVDYVNFAARFLRVLQRGGKLAEAYTTAFEKSPEHVRTHVARGWESEAGLEEASAKLGRTCYLKEALPLSLYVLKNTGSYTEAVRNNILAGGDSCGRSMLVGAAAATLYALSPQGIDPAWISRVKKAGEVSARIDG